MKTNKTILIALVLIILAGIAYGGLDKESTVYKDLIRLESPRAGDTISSPVIVRGEARGTWYFEASFPITIVNWDGLIIGEGYAQAQDNWMTEDYVPFEGKIEFTYATDTPYDRGAIIFQKENPSGLPEHDDAFEIPVRF
ncbi:MAG: Gmad2 immunoglobulin-like domain-containing protein [Patescibacteria group bacterium]